MKKKITMKKKICSDSKLGQFILDSMKYQSPTKTAK